MASSTWLFSMGLVFILVGLSGPNAKAQSGYTNVLIGMASCLNYVTGSSSNPSSSCCSQLASVVQSEPQCLCTALNGGSTALGININQTLTLALPRACNVRTLPVSRCDVFIAGPESSPMASQESALADSPNANPDSKPSHAMSGSETVLSNGYGSATRISLPIVVIIMMSSYPSI